MLIEGLINEKHLPLVLAAPLLPLALIFTRKIAIRQSTFLLALLSTGSLISGFFVVMAAGSLLQLSFMRLGFFIQLIFSALLLKGCTQNIALRQGILGLIGIFAASYFTYLLSVPNGNFAILLKTGIIIVFLIAISVMISQVSAKEQLFNKPDFWFAGGVFFHSGLISILLYASSSSTDQGSTGSNEYSVLYLLILFIQSLFFSSGILLQKTSE